jgi:predicted ATP-grasp superfamily ATP-dependent carboligase
LKRKGSKLTIFGKLIIEPWIDNFASEIRLQEESEFKIANDFIIGDDVHIRLSKGAQVEFLGKKTNRAQASLQGQ